ncbi:hypothetical protein NDU88_000393 [Pleurodeles waltl]|uniref:WAP domain-containing protein n=1 Tax=Pleurodeles waltl TaxID=8319 RepID=A0AAV7P436_PLEWA|nr:hypothetical protein NDU88_000393 [Pleurodeles waltl]
MDLVVETLKEPPGSQDVQHPGMCFEDYMLKHSAEFEKLNKKVLEELDLETNGPGSDAQSKHWPENEQGGSHPDRKPKLWPMIDFSTLKNCSVEQDCELSEKCCRTMCGMRCTEPMFEHHDVHFPDEADDQESDGNVQQRAERAISDEDESEEEDSSSEEDHSGQRWHKSGREKRSHKEDGQAKGKEGKEHGKGRGGLKESSLEEIAGSSPDQQRMLRRTRTWMHILIRVSIENMRALVSI